MSNPSKHIIAILLSLFLLALTACEEEIIDAPNVLSPTVMVNDVLYYFTDHSIRIDDETVTGYIISTVPTTEFPTQNGEANIPCLDAPYCVIEEGVAVFFNNKWFLFEALE